MKKNAALLLATFIIFSTAKAQQDASLKQIVFPHEVYVGDRAELSYQFYSEEDFFSYAQEEAMQGGELTLKTDVYPLKAEESDVTFTNAALHKSGSLYTLKLSFIPWKIGAVRFTPFNLYDVIPLKKDLESGEGSFVIHLEAVSVASLAEKLNAENLAPPIPPLLLPGTQYAIWAAVLILLLIIFLIGFTFRHFSLLKDGWTGFFARIRASLFAHKTKRSLKRLLSSAKSDADFAHGWQNIMRTYLGRRFASPFLATTTKSLALKISAAVGGELGAHEENAVLSLISIFTRTDYILFAKDSIDSRLFPASEHAASFLDSEKKEIIKETLLIIDGFETGQKKEKEVSRAL